MFFYIHVHVYVRLHAPVHLSSHKVYTYVLELQKWKSPIIFLKISLLYNLLLSYNIWLYIIIIILYYIIIYIIILSNFFREIQLSVMAMVVTIMPFCRPISWHSLYINFTKKYMYWMCHPKFTVNTFILVKILHISSLNYYPWFWNSAA